MRYFRSYTPDFVSRSAEQLRYLPGKLVGFSKDRIKQVSESKLRALQTGNGVNSTGQVMSTLERSEDPYATFHWAAKRFNWKHGILLSRSSCQCVRAGVFASRQSLGIDCSERSVVGLLMDPCAEPEFSNGD